MVGPEDAGLAPAPLAAIAGGDAAENAAALPQKLLAHGAKAVKNDAGNEEERGFDEGVAEDIGEEGGVGDRATDGESGEHEAGVGDGGKGEHALEVVLGVAHQAADEDGGRGKGEQDAAEGGGVRGEGLGEDDAVQAGDGIEAELHHEAAEEHAHRGGRDGMGVGQPEVERDDGALDEKATDEQRKGKQHQGIVTRGAGAV